MIDTVTGQGSTTTVRASGKVKVECADAKAGMHLNRCDYSGTFTNVEGGKPVAGGVYPNYKGTLSSAGFNGFKEKKIFSVSGTNDWTFNLKHYQNSNGNAGTPQLLIYEWK